MTFLPEIFIPPLRLGATPDTLDALLEEPLLFAAHYAAVSQGVPWPQSVLEVVSTVTARYTQHDQVLLLMDRLRKQVSVTLTADHARHLAEGLELHPVVRKAPTTYREACAAYLKKYLTLCAGAPDENTPSGRIAFLAQHMAFSHGETQVLAYALANNLFVPLQLLTRQFCAQRFKRALFWQTALDLSADALRAALAPRGRLAGAGLLQTAEAIPKLSEFWAELLVNENITFAAALLQPVEHKASPGGASRLPAEDRELLSALLQTREKATGINILLYGKPAVDKQRLAQRLILDAGATPYTLTPDLPERERAAAVMLAQRLLAQQPAPAVLVVEKAQSVLTRVYPGGFAFFGFAEEEDDVQPQDERLLAENPVPTLWLTHEAQRLHPETLSRFLFHAEALKGSRAERRAMVESLIDALPVASRHKQELVKLEGLSEQQVSAAQQVATLTAGRSRRTYAKHLLLAASRSQKALARKGKDEARLPVTRYSLDYLHTVGRFGPEQIRKALIRHPQGSLCLYGLPGTGKTQFAEHLALELGKPILLKRASDLFDKYLGESEKRIGEAFDQAEEEGAVLLLDEADSFLRDRSRSSQHWEVSTVNELLQRMERFDGVFVCTTNLYEQLDIAALRRFTFKLEFLPLQIHQRWEMFLNEAELRNKKLSEAQQSDYEERLALMKNLTPGDFATVKRQCVLLGETLSPREWLDQLEMEVVAKNRQTPADPADARAA